MRAHAVSNQMRRTAVSRGSGADAKPSPESGGVGRVGYPAEGGVQSGVTPGCEPGVSGMYRVPASVVPASERSTAEATQEGTP